MLYLLVSSIISHHRWFAFDGARGVNDLLYTISVNVHAIQSLLLPCANRWSSWSQWFLGWFGVHAEICLTCVYCMHTVSGRQRYSIILSLWLTLSLSTSTTQHSYRKVMSNVSLSLCVTLSDNYHTERCVCCPMSTVTVQQPEPRQTMPHWVPPSPPASGEDTKMMSRCQSLNHQLLVQAHNCDLRKWCLAPSRSPLVPIGARSRF